MSPHQSTVFELPEPRLQLVELGTPREIDVTTYDGEPYELWWMCRPPANGESFTVVREEWLPLSQIRMIYEWKPASEA